jgi:hypothetical protein
VKIRLLTDIHGGWSGGGGFQYWDSRRGDIVEATEAEGERLVRVGYACTDLKCDARDLPRPFQTKYFLG